MHPAERPGWPAVTLADGRPVVVRRAGRSDLDRVLAVLDEAAGWLHDRGVVQWPPRFTRRWLDEPMARREIWLAECEGQPVGTLRLSAQDPAWADHPDGTGYVHGLAVRRWAAGLGARLLVWAADRILADGGDRLRLDCVASNATLRRYYERQGFLHRGEVVVHGPPSDRGTAGPEVMVSLYELVLAEDPPTRR